MGKPSIDLPPQIPDHELICLIGNGSYGEVWLARAKIGAYRAVKVVHGKRFGDDSRSFHRELEGLKLIEPISRSHPSLVAILHFGENLERGYFYYVMELADDRGRGTEIDPATYEPRTLASEARHRRRLPPGECVDVGLALTDALDKLDEAGLVHRDIKPSNIIFVNGVPKLADIGLVSDVESAQSYVGTEGFIPPEGPGTPQADIYSLGKVLYEISTGKDRVDFPALPPDLAEQKDKAFLELNEVLLKACATQVKDRYADAKSMQADLALLKGGNSVRRLRMLESSVKVAKQVGLLLAIAIPTVFFFFHQYEENRRRKAEIRQLLLGGHLAEGAHALDRGDFSGALGPSLMAFEVEQGDGKRADTHRLRLRSILDQCPKLEQILFHDDAVVERSEFALGGSSVVTAVKSGKARVWNIQTGQPVGPPFAAGNSLVAASFSPDERYVVTTDHYRGTDIWKFEAGEWSISLSLFEKGLHSARFSPDGRRVITAGKRGACIWRFLNGEMEAVLSGAHGSNALRHAGYSGDGRRIVTTGEDGRAVVWDSAAAKPLLMLRHNNWVYYGEFSPDGRYLVSASFDRTARLWDANTGELLFPEMDHGDAVVAARFSPDGRYILTACLDGTARIWDVRTRQLISQNGTLHHGDRVMDASFSPDGRRVLVACGDGTARIWDLAGGAGVPFAATPDFYSANGSRVNVQQIQPVLPDITVQALAGSQLPKYALSRNGRFLAEVKVVGDLSHIQAWDLHSLKPIAAAFEADLGPPVGACISEDGKHGLIYSARHAALFDLRARKLLGQPSTAAPVAAAAFSPDGRYLAMCAGQESVVIEVASGKLQFRPKFSDGRVRFVDFSADSRKLVLCSTSGSNLKKCSAEVWFPESRTRLASVLRHGDGILMGAFSPNGRQLITASEDFYANVWDAEKGEQLIPSLRHSYKVNCANFSLSGEWIVTADAEGNVRLWDAATRRPLTPPLQLPEGTPHRARFVENDAAVFVTTEEGHAWLWRLPKETRSPQELAQLYDLVAGRRNVEANRFRTSSPDQLKQAWVMFNANHPEDFRASAGEIKAWHERELKQAEAGGQTNAMRFHADAMKRYSN